MSVDAGHLTVAVEQAIRGAAVLAMQGVDLTTLEDIVEEIRNAARKCFESALVTPLRARNSRTVAFALPNELWTSTWSLLPIEDRFSVSRVCYTWRDMALSSPTLWTEIYLPFQIKNVPEGSIWLCSNCSDQDCSPTQFSSLLHSLEPLLLRSRGLPVCMRIRNFAYRSHIDLMDKLVRMLDKHSSRIQELHISSRAVEDFVPNLLSGLQSLPALRKLSVISLGRGLPGLDPLEALSLRALALSRVEDLHISDGFEWAMGPQSPNVDLSLPSLRKLTMTIYHPAPLGAALKAGPGLISVSLRPSFWSRVDWEPWIISRLVTIPSICIEGMTTEYGRWFAQTFAHALRTDIRVIYDSGPPTSDAFAVLKSFTAPVHLSVTTVSTDREDEIVMEFKHQSRSLMFQWGDHSPLDELKWNALPASSLVSLDFEASMWPDLLDDLPDASSIRSLTLRVFSCEENEHDDIDGMLSEEALKDEPHLPFPGVREFSICGLRSGSALSATQIAWLVKAFGFPRLQKLELRRLQVRGGYEGLAELADEVFHDSKLLFTH